MIFFGSQFKFIIAWVMVIALFGFATPVEAQSVRRGLVISPAILEIEQADRGRIYDLKITVENDTDNQNYQVSTAIQTFVGTSEEGIPAIGDFPKNADFSSWISLPESKFSLAKGARKDFPLRVSIPDQASPGDHYFAITFIPESGAVNSEANVQISQRLVALLFISVKGKVQREVNIEQIQADKQVYDPFFDAISLQYKVKVVGNSYLKPAGNISLGDSKAISDVSIPLNPDQKIVLPNSSRTFAMGINSSWSLPYLSSSVAALLLPLTVQAATPAVTPASNVVNANKPWFGSYPMEIKILYVNSDGELTQKTSSVQLLFFPWKFILIQLVLLTVIIGIWYIRRRILQTNPIKP